MNGRLAVAAAVLVQAFAASAETHLQIDMEALAELLPLAAEAIEIHIRAGEREAAHAAELAKKGVAEVPPSGSQRYVIDTSILPDFAFDARGELYIDRRFVTDEELETVHAIERWIAKWFPQETKARAVPRASAGKAKNVPVFRGFEDDRYQMHDGLIARMVAEFNADKAGWCGGTVQQASKIADLTPALVKSHMIEESGGNGARSKAAWAADPQQVNVPGDWGDEKKLVGLSKPSKRNEGTLDGNVRAAIMYLSRKGFGSSGRPAKDRPKGFFDGWLDAFRRYNGRRDRTDTDRYYGDEYADRIVKRADSPDVFVPIEIKLAK
ncbi:MAG: hypothetical protein ILO34_08110 [Kiritimatiellae bacterium]|nr:hypothetical protein [Kiritimatiellia bacterium]